MQIGDLLDIKVIVDDIIINQTLTITFIYKNYIFTCGHCLPSNSIISNGKVVYTSGFDNPNEDIELGIIKMNYNIVSNFKLMKLKKFIKLNFYNLILIHNRINYNITNIKILNNYEFKNLKINELNHLIDNFYIYHTINKLSGSFIGIAYSEEKTKSIDKEIHKIIKNYKLLTNKIFYLTEPSYSGSPIVYNNYVIGYHIGSTYGFKIINNKIIWIGKFIYYKCLII